MAASWPAGDDLRALILSLGLAGAGGPAVIDALALGAKVAAGVAEFGARTRWQPFLADAASSTRIYDWPAAGVLNLDGGLVSLDSVSSGGLALTAGMQYVPKPDNAPARGRPFTSVVLRAGLSVPLGTAYALGYRRTVEVTGRWGFAAALPPDVFSAVLSYAAAQCVPELALSISRGRAELREGDAMYRFASSGVSPLSAERAQWETTFNKTVGFYKRVLF